MLSRFVGQGLDGISWKTSWTMFDLWGSKIVKSCGVYSWTIQCCFDLSSELLTISEYNYTHLNTIYVLCQISPEI